MFWQDCFAHSLQGVCKADILDCNSEYDKGKIVMCVAAVGKSRDLCHMDKEEFTWFKITSKDPKLC